MKKFILYLNILFCFSTLLEEVRKENVDKALLYLPKRENVDLLKMIIQIARTIEKYSLTNAETAQLVYKWIGQNFKNDCSYGNDTTLPESIYKNGEGGDIGIAKLFNMIMNYLDIESNIIIGIKKIRLYSYKGNKIEIKDSAWNSILIGDKYYLLDAADGTNEVYRCDDFNYGEKDGYFGIEPELSLRFRFPDEQKWQLTPKYITREIFKKQAILFEGYFKYFKNISHDVQTLEYGDKYTITLTVKDPNIKKLYFYEENVEVGYKLPAISLFDIEKEVINGTIKYDLFLFSDSCYYSVDVFDESEEHYRLFGYNIYSEEYNNNK